MQLFVNLKWFQKPVAWARPGGLITRYDTQKQLKNFLGYQTRRQMGRLEPTKEPVIVEVNFYFRKTKPTDAMFPTWKNDVDNLSKLILDVCNGICYVDDGQVVRLVASKYWTDEQPRTTMTIYICTPGDI